MQALSAGERTEAIRWRDAATDPPPDFCRVLGTLQNHPEQPAGECYTTGRPVPIAYFPGLNNNYRLGWWAELPTGPK